MVIKEANNSRRPWNVLVFPGGTEVGLEINKSLRSCKEVLLFSAGSSVPNHAAFFFEQHFILPDVRHPECLSSLVNLIQKQRIDFVFPANPLVMDFLNPHRDSLPCPVVMPKSEVFDLVRSKRATYEALKDILPVPIVYDPLKVPEFPVFLKPDRLYGSQGGRRIDSAAELVAVGVRDGEILCEYLPGEEYTVDCFSSACDGLLFAGPRTRERIRMGTSMRSSNPETCIKTELQSYAIRLQARLGLTGPWFFQMKCAQDGKLKLLEVDPRVAGTMAYHRVHGVNFPLLALYEQAGMRVEIHASETYGIQIDRALANRYFHLIDYETVYIDLDDTIVNKGKLDTDMMKFLYQCVNEGKKIVLISKSLEKDKYGFLVRWRIRELFDEVIWLDESESKADYIRDIKSIYIDDSFSQRREVNRRWGIPTFDSSMIELLINDRGI